MKILFICGSLETGKDGVGDYTRSMSGALMAKGHEVYAIAINDTHISKDVKEVQKTENGDVQVLRISSGTDVKIADAEIENVIKLFSPDWVSIQFVPFAFNLKGLPYNFGSRIKNFIGNSNVHIMFHEMYMGHAGIHFNKKYLVGQLQKWIYKKLVKTLKPKKVNTNTMYYSYLLQKMGVKNEVLPLISNLGIENNPEKYYSDLLNKTGVDFLNNKYKRAIIFGSIPQGEWNLDDVLKKWESSIIRENKEGILLICGKNGIDILNLIKELEAKYKKIKFLSFGLLEEHEVSSLMQCADFGINPTPLYIYEKSGVIAAMLQHGLPVVLTRKGSVDPEFIKKDIQYPDNIFFTENMDERIVGSLHRKSVNDNIISVTNQLVKYLTS